MIETERLSIVPLSSVELACYLQAPEELVRLLGLQFPVAPLDENLKEAIENSFLPNLLDHNKNDLFYTLWIIIEKKQQCIIGGICFHGEPNEKGEAEIGYGVDEAFQNSGYMTEALEGIIEWSKNIDELTSLIAETGTANHSSVRVLEKCGFKVVNYNNENVIMKYMLNR